MTAPSSPSAPSAWTAGWSKHRAEGLTDGIFAVAMTLLVIELKIPDAHLIHTRHDLLQALADLLPKVLSWIVSFFVLAIFWVSHHRLFHYVRVVDGGLLWLNIVQLALIALMPFCAALLGEFAIMPVAQSVYSVNMILIGLMSLTKLRYLRRHPELASHPMEPGTYDAARTRIVGLVAMGCVAIAIAQTPVAPLSTMAYLMMIPIGRYSRHIEARGRLRSAALPAVIPAAIPAPAPIPTAHP